MKKIITMLAFAAALAGAANASAQEQSDKAARKAAVKEEIKAHIKPYGFFRSYAFYDTRATKSLTEDLFFFMPLDRQTVNESDLNAVGNFGYQAMTTRIGLNVVGYKIGSTSIEGKLETDFYCLNSGGNVATLRMRQAYMKLSWEPSEKFAHSLLIGQTWHPLAADMPNTIALETGAPFSPFNRSAQLMYNADFGKSFSLTAGLIEQMQYRSSGPDGGTNKYQRHAILPEVYAGLSFRKGGFLGRAGVSILSIRPHYGYIKSTITIPAQTAIFVDKEGHEYELEVFPESTLTNLHDKKYKEWLTTFNPFIFLQYTGKNGFQVKAKAVYAQSGEHMQLSGGYAATGTKEDGFSRDYTPTQSLVSFVSAQYGKKFQVLGMIGYHKNLGLVGGKEMLNGKEYYFSGNSFKNVNQMLRVSPTLAYNLGKFQFAVEYDFTMVQYGDGFNADGTVTKDLHWIGNHRILGMAKFSF